MNRKPKILIIDSSRGVTGALGSVIRSSTYLRDDFDFEFLLPSGSKAVTHVRQHGFRTHELPMQELRRNLFSVLSYIPVLLLNLWRFFGLQRSVGADVIHSNDAYNLLAPLYKVFGGRAPYVCHFRFMPSRFPGNFLKFMLRLHHGRAARLVVVSAAVAKEFPEGIRCVIVYDGLPPDEGSTPTVSGKVLLYPASYTRGKGQDFALRAFARIAGEFPGWKLRFVGTDFDLEKNKRYKQELEALTQRLDLVGKVELEGEAASMRDEYRGAAIVLNFSLSESFSLTCQEAQLSGRPVIATNSGGPAEIVAQDESGMLVPVGDLESMSKAMKTLMSDPTKRSSMGQRGMKLMRERFSAKQTFERLKEVYIEALRRSA